MKKDIEIQVEETILKKEVMIDCAKGSIQPCLEFAGNMLKVDKDICIMIEEKPEPSQSMWDVALYFTFLGIGIGIGMLIGGII